MQITTKPILLTGAHRSGTTWLANMLALGGGVQIASEPFNLDSWAYRLGGLAKYWFTYAPGLPQDSAKEAFKRVLSHRTGRIYGRRTVQRYLPFTRQGRVLVKDPIACFSSAWLAENFPLDVIVLVRHPAAFAASLKRMNWRFHFCHLLEQEALMDDLLQPFRNQMESQPDDIVDQAALLWVMIYYALSGFLNRYPDWTVVRHESLSAEPLSGIRRLYDQLGLNWSPEVASRIGEYTGASNPVDPKTGIAHQMKRDSAKNIKRWKNVLSADEVTRVRVQTQNVASLFYGPEDW